MSGGVSARWRERAANGELDPAKVEVEIAGTEADLATLRAKHDEIAAEADDLWRQVLRLEQRLDLLQEVRAAIPAPVLRQGGGYQ